MKTIIRRGVFETNSSSTHSLTMTSKEEYDKWQSGELVFNEWDKTFHKVDSTEAKNDDCKTCDEFWDDCDYETFHEEYKSPSGDVVVAFGYYGGDY